jgi:hypothetical protein
MNFRSQIQVNPNGGEVDRLQVKSTISRMLVVAVLIVLACGGSPPAAETKSAGGGNRSEGPAEPVQADIALTLGITPQQFVDTWNQVISEGMPALVLTELAATQESEVFESELSEILVLRVTVDEESGELIRAMVSSLVDFGDEYDGWLFLGATSGLIAASNRDLDEPALIDEAFEQIGIPDVANPPAGFGDGDYQRSALIQGVLYTFTETPEDYVLAAQPSG